MFRQTTTREDRTEEANTDIMQAQQGKQMQDSTLEHIHMLELSMLRVKEKD